MCSACMPNFGSLNVQDMNRQERIAKAIAASGKQKQQIATECGVSNASVSQWISGESKSMKPENLYALAWPDKSSNQSRSHKPAMCGFFCARLSGDLHLA